MSTENADLLLFHNELERIRKSLLFLFSFLLLFFSYLVIKRIVVILRVIFILSTSTTILSIIISTSLSLFPLFTSSFGESSFFIHFSIFYYCGHCIVILVDSSILFFFLFLFVQFIYFIP